MITAGSLVWTALLPALISAGAWVCVMLWLGHANFKDDLSRREDWRNLSPELLTQQIEYHNNAAYRSFEFYIKILLAVLAGIALLATKEPVPTDRTKFLLDAAGWVVVVVSFLFSVHIVLHQKSKIERWSKGYRWYEPLVWSECWGIAFAATICIFTRLTMIPALLK